MSPKKASIWLGPLETCTLSPFPLSRAAPVPMRKRGINANTSSMYDSYRSSFRASFSNYYYSGSCQRAESPRGSTISTSFSLFGKLQSHYLGASPDKSYRSCRKFLKMHPLSNPPALVLPIQTTQETANQSRATVQSALWSLTYRMSRLSGARQPVGTTYTRLALANGLPLLAREKCSVSTGMSTTSFFLIASKSKLTRLKQPL
jgi:hypothetical protein